MLLISTCASPLNSLASPPSTHYSLLLLLGHESLIQLPPKRQKCVSGGGRVVSDINKTNSQIAKLIPGPRISVLITVSSILTGKKDS